MKNERHVLVDDCGGDLGRTGIEADGHERGASPSAAPAGTANGCRLTHLRYHIVWHHLVEVFKNAELVRDVDQIGPCHKPLLDDLELFCPTDAYSRRNHAVGDESFLNQKSRRGRIDIWQLQGGDTPQSG